VARAGWINAWRASACFSVAAPAEAPDRACEAVCPRKRFDLQSIGSLEKTLRPSPAGQAEYRYFFQVLDSRHLRHHPQPGRAGSWAVV